MPDIVENPENYFRQLVPERDALLMDLEAEADAEGIPIVGPVVGGLLFVLARATRAQSILELGTATGYSTIWLGRGCSQAGGRILTLEYDADMAERARKNIARANLSETVSVCRAEAIEMLPGLTGQYDMVFMDIEKQDYRAVLGQLEPLVRPGGLLLADNTGFKDADAFNQAIFSASGWESVQIFSYLPKHSGIYDGLCFAVRL
ncbi:MAG: O-methyltransferase [Desulfobacterales bacterium]|nr:O-methyltransferase [Desulfobacterales bacterium]